MKFSDSFCKNTKYLDGLVPVSKLLSGSNSDWTGQGFRKNSLDRVRPKILGPRVPIIYRYK